MRAGTLRERVTIQAPGMTADATWGPTEGYSDVDTVAASVIAADGGEVLRSGAGALIKDEGITAFTTYDVLLRYRPDVSSQNRLIWRGKTLDIVSAIDPDGRRRSLKIVAKEHQ